jgi:hypothetical protein
MVSILQSKHIEWQVGLKRKNIPFVDYNNCISLTKTNIGLGCKDGNIFSK